MKITLKHIIGFISIVVFCFLAWYFRRIVAYILISGVLAIMGQPLVNLLCKIHIGKWKFPRALSALITLFVIWGLVIAFLLIFVPLITKQITYLASIDSSKLLQLIEAPLNKLSSILGSLGNNVTSAESLLDYISEALSSILDLSQLQNLLGSAVGILGSMVITIFAISFITFFFLKDQHLFFDSILMWIPDKYTEGFTRALTSIQNLLSRYLIGIICESICVMIIVDIGMTIVGIDFQQALVMGLIIGVLNVIPYIGPWIGFFIAMVMGVASHINMDFATVVGPLMIYMAIVVAIAQVIDNIFFQPIIYSNSVKAHPLEIFVVVLAAGSISGVGGMILGIPSYTVLRVLAKEFFNNFKAVQKITSSLDDTENIKSVNIFKRKDKEPPEPPIMNTEK